MNVAVSGGSSPGDYALGAVDSPSRRLNQYISSPLSQYAHDQRGNTRAESAHCRGDIAPPNQTNTQPEPVCGPPASAAAVDKQDFWLHADDLFSATSVTDASGEVVERYDYHDYGFPLILDPDGQPAGVNAQGLYASKVGNPYLFTGREWDAESKLYHYRTRAYHPGLGRFMQIDRIGVWGDVAQFGNGFAGLAGNPGRWGDPFGLNCDGGNKDTAPPGVPPQYRDPIYKDLWPDLDRNNPANDFPLFNDEEMRRQLEFYDKEWKDALKRYEESGLKLAVEIGVIVVMTVTPLDEAAFIGWAAARGCIVVRNAAGAIIGFARGARIASKVGDDLVAAAQRAAETIGPGKGAERGKAIHSEFKKIVDSLEIPGVSTEQSFIDGRAARHGLKESIRVDVIQRDSANNVVAVFDLKTGGASLSNQRSQQIRSHLPGGGQNIPVIEIHVP